MKQITKLAIPLGVVFIVVMLVVPLPAGVLDLLIAINITGAVLILLTAMFVQRPLDFAAFPSVLLVMTLFRLALNVSATRLVLLDGYAGKVIDTFGHFVIGGSLIVGLIVFVILLIIQFVVITNGAGRVAEVGARFTLDAMPGKQMAIDADLNSGLITEEEAKRRREDVHAEADFYGAMDGASKFVKGDAIAAIIITVVNLLGGFAIGVMQMDMPMGEAANTYALLSVGDGLVSQIPALLLSVATGLIVTRAVSAGDMGSDILGQIGRRKTPLRIAGFSALALCLIPGLPKMPFLITGGLMLIFAARAEPDEEAGSALKLADETLNPMVASAVNDTPEGIAADILVDPLGLELSADIIDLVDVSTGGDLLDRVKALRRKVAGEIGVVIPPVRTRDNADLPGSTYVIKLFGVEMARGTAPRDTVLAIGDALGTLPGTATREPVFGLEAKWIPIEMRHQAEISGATVIDRSSVITTHMSEVVTKHAGKLLGREDVRLLTDVVKRTHPVVIEELTPVLLSLGEIQQVLRGLLDEGIAVRDLVRIFEALSLRATISKDPDGLIEAARMALGQALVAPYLKDGVVSAISFNPMLEQRMFEAMRTTENGMVVSLDPDLAQRIALSLNHFATAAEETGVRPILVCAPQLRVAVRRLVEPAIERLPVLSYSEITGATGIRSVGVVTGDQADTPGQTLEVVR